MKKMETFSLKEPFAWEFFVIFLGNHLAVYIELHVMGYGITYLALNSISLLLLTTCLLTCICSSLLSLKCQEIEPVKHSFIVQVYCENRFIY